MTDLQASGRDDALRNLQVRAAWFYYVEGVTQEEIAHALGVSRAKVVRLLVGARQEGVVRIEVQAQSGRQVALERGLIARFGLQEAVVVAAPADDRDVAAVVGHAAGRYVSSQIRDGIAIAVGWGETLSMALPALATPAFRGAAVISLLGGMTHSRAVNPSAVAQRLADALAGECYQLTAPLLVAGAALRDALWNEGGLRDLRARARAADLALVSVGDVSRDATLFRERLLPPAEMASLRKAGAVGDVLCHFLDAKGRPVEHPLASRVVAIGLGELAGARRIVLASGGARKVAILRAALAALPVHVLVTDTAAAEGLLAA